MDNPFKAEFNKVKALFFIIIFIHYIAEICDTQFVCLAKAGDKSGGHLQSTT